MRLLGYVHTSYAQRNISLARRDIETYAAWPSVSSNPDLAVRGIFFDETPQQYDADSFAYLQNLTDLVKSVDGMGSDPFVSRLLLSLSVFDVSRVLVLFPPYIPSCSAGFAMPSDDCMPHA